MAAPALGRAAALAAAAALLLAALALMGARPCACSETFEAPAWLADAPSKIARRMIRFSNAMDSGGDDEEPDDADLDDADLDDSDLDDSDLDVEVPDEEARVMMGLRARRRSAFDAIVEHARSEDAFDLDRLAAALGAPGCA